MDKMRIIPATPGFEFLICHRWRAEETVEFEWELLRYPVVAWELDGNELLPLATYLTDNLFGHDGLLKAGDDNRAARHGLLRPDGSVQDIDSSSRTFDDIPKWMEWARKSLHDCWGDYAKNDDEYAEATDDQSENTGVLQ